MDSRAFAYLSVGELSAGFASGEFTPADVVEGLRDRVLEIDAPDSDVALRSVLALNQKALAADSELGPLAGIPVLVKDNIEAVDLPGTAGSAALAGRTVERDAVLVSRLRAAGAIIFGATNLSEWANIRSSNSTSGWSAVGGLCKNPWVLSRSAGGSSSGSGAAVAAGLAPLAVGTETDGSIVCPASLNGVVGIKPTVGTVSTRGVVPISSSQDSPGPLARSVKDAALLLEVLSGQRGLQEATEEPTGHLRFGVVEPWFIGHSETDSLVNSVLNEVGWAKRADFPVIPDEIHGDELTVLLAELHDELGEFLKERSGLRVQSLADVVAFNQAHAELELKHFDQNLFEKALEIGGKTAAYREARQRCLDWSTAAFAHAFNDFDLLLAPAYGPSWRSNFELGHKEATGGAVTSPAALLGLPIISVPVGLVDDLPVGLAIVGPAGSEKRLIAAAAHIERTVAFCERPKFLLEK